MDKKTIKGAGDRTRSVPKSRLLSIAGIVKATAGMSNEELTVPEVADALTAVYNGEWMIYDGRGYGLAEPILGVPSEEHSGYNERMDIICELFNSKFWDKSDSLIAGIDPSDYMMLKEDGVVLAQRLWEYFYPDADSLAAINEVSLSAVSNSTEREGDGEATGVLLEIRRYVDASPVKFGMAICEGVLSEAPEIAFYRATNIQIPMPEPRGRNHINNRSTRYAYLAKLVLRKLANFEEHGFSTEIRFASEHVSIKEAIEEWVNCNPFTHGWEYRSPYFSDIASAFFDKHREALGTANQIIAEYVYRGVPIYRLSPEGQFIPVESSNEHYSFLNVLGQDSVDLSIYKLDEWVNRYYFKAEHLNKNDIFFASDSISEEDHVALRFAFRRSLGMPEDFRDNHIPNSESASSRGHSRLLDIVSKVLSRYYGDQFNADDPDTWTKQDAVIAWLKDTYQLSTRQAEAVDIVTRPDKARNR